ncbi:hypothetical protein V6Z12_A10G255800 [Gossypium hirsutum]
MWMFLDLGNIWQKPAGLLGWSSICVFLVRFCRYDGQLFRTNGLELLRRKDQIGRMRFLLANHKFAAPSRFRPELVNVDQLDWSSFSETKRKSELDRPDWLSFSGTESGRFCISNQNNI